MEIKLIAFDLDGTLLNSQKELLPEVLDELKRVKNLGVELVPVTGRFWEAVPKNVSGLDFINYAVTVNGAEVYDVKNSKVLSRADIPLKTAITIMRVFDGLPVFYDCIVNGMSWMKREHYAHIKEFALDEVQYKMLRDLRNPVDDIQEFLMSRGQNVQKMQLFTLDKNFRSELLRALPVIFPDNAISSSVPNNVEVNDKNANKGAALKILSEKLNIAPENIMAFGDGLNDISMIKYAGIGVAMNNAEEDLKAAANYITENDCDHAGVAEAVKKFCVQ